MPSSSVEASVSSGSSGAPCRRHRRAFGHALCSRSTCTSRRRASDVPPLGVLVDARLRPKVARAALRRRSNPNADAVAFGPEATAVPLVDNRERRRRRPVRRPAAPVVRLPMRASSDLPGCARHTAARTAVSQRRDRGAGANHGVDSSTSSASVDNADGRAPLPPRVRPAPRPRTTASNPVRQLVNGPL